MYIAKVLQFPIPSVTLFCVFVGTLFGTMEAAPTVKPVDTPDGWYQVGELREENGEKLAHERLR